MHRLLKRQVKRLLGEIEALPKAVESLLDVVSATYEQNDADRAMLEHSLDIVSEEMGQQNCLLSEELKERQAAESRLEHSLSILGATLNSTDDGVLVMGNDRSIENYNDKFVDMWSVPRWIVEQPDDSLLSEHLARLLVDPEPQGQLLSRLFNSDEKSLDILKLKDGRVFERYTQPRWIGGNSVGRVWRFQDITERHHADAELRISASAFQSQEAMVISDARGIILRVNQAFTESTGYSIEEAVGRTTQQLRLDQHYEVLIETISETLARTGRWQGESWGRRKNGEIYPTWMCVSAVKGAQGEITHYIGTHIDISERKKSEQRIEQLAFFDQLTGLPNRTLFLDRVKRALTSSALHNRYGALMLLDMDNFKTLNDTLGHDVGDKFIAEVGRRLQTCVQKNDTVARLGGDEFVVLLEELTEDTLAAMQAESVAVTVLKTIDQPYQLDSISGYLSKHIYHGTVSIGITLFRGDTIPVDELLKRADLAMYQAKAAGRNTIRFFDPEMQAVVMGRVELEADLRASLHMNQFRLYYQPQVDKDGRMTGAEALIRWQHPSRGLVSPADFIPLAEDTGLILPLGRWVLETACTQLAVWAEKPETAHLSLAVNVSAHQFHHPDFVDQVLAVLEQTGADPQRLKLELTESMLLKDVEDIIVKMSVLKVRGVGFSLDDFGTGYSSLSYLKRLPLDLLKIDKSFVQDILIDPNDAAIARTIVALAQSMGLKVIAEGVETKEQRDFLASVGCYSYQGYYFGRPSPIDDFEKLFGADAVLSQ
jgi:diguanylate cyclase (GGDEF)-like protein/PAS domain S-box-containing protein